MKRKVDGERLLRAFYADELSDAAARIASGRPDGRKRASRGRSSAVQQELEAARRVTRERAYRPVLAVAASLAVAAAGAIAPRPTPAEPTGLYLMVDTFGELAKGAGLLEPFGPHR